MTEPQPRIPGSEAFEGALYEDRYLGSPTLVRRARLAADFSRVFGLPLEACLERVDENEKLVKLALLDAGDEWRTKDLGQVLIDRGLAG